MTESGKPKKVLLTDKGGLDDLTARARDSVLKWLTRCSSFTFWEPSIRVSFTPYQLARFLGFKRNHDCDMNSVERALERVQIGEFTTFTSTFSTFEGYRPELWTFEEQVHAIIRQTGFDTGGETIVLYRIQDRKTLATCLTPNDKGSFNVHDVCSSLRHVRLHKGVALGFSFQDPDPWTVYLRPKSDWTWQQIQDALEDLDQLLSLEERFGLGSEAAALLQWIESLDQSEWYRNLTPSVEDHLKTQIGLKPDCNRENLPVLVQMLIDEINEKTDYHLRIQIWKVYDRNSTRILVNERTSDLDRIVREIQCFALKTDKVLMRQEVIDALESLLQPTDTTNVLDAGEPG